ncbi:ABC transporter ATP-binding protein [Asticcacaulis excentricus]|uniref:ABC O-antigen transporter, ATP-binding component n=1 Tax=Asticcacaulis excentricus TaxID=78587 RepID=A0A3G9GA98_9CAUL|nr:ABC transporter ATP-binding protein [Asticcacaulis excentricus]BBF81379.1 ABC O-antigen transporter, ATP-binding component [Asticcacaulis excentricus]
MSLVNLAGVELTYPIYSVRAQSLRNAIANLAVGGKLLKDGHDVVNVRALSHITFSLEDGDRLGIIGHNGAGKTTLLKVLAGVYEPDHGLVDVKGKVSSMIDVNLGLDAELTGRENVINMGRIRGFSTRQLLQKLPEIVEFTELGAFIDLPLKTYSAGMMTRLIFGVATSLDPEILLMDEWIGAGDKGFFDKATQRLNDIVTRAKVIILASHNWALISGLCNKLLVLDGGAQVYFGPLEGWDEQNNRAR